MVVLRADKKDTVFKTILAVFSVLLKAHLEYQMYLTLTFTFFSQI